MAQNGKSGNRRSSILRKLLGSGFRGAQRNANFDQEPTGNLVARNDGTPVQGYGALSDSQSEAGTPSGADPGIIDAIERFEERGK